MLEQPRPGNLEIWFCYVLLQNGGYMWIHTPELFFVWRNVAFTVRIESGDK